MLWTAYLLTGVLVFLFATTLWLPQMFGRLRGPVLGIGALTLILFLPQFVVFELFLAAVLRVPQHLDDGRCLGGALLRLVGWALALGHGLRAARAKPRLDGRTLEDDTLPFTPTALERFAAWLPVGRWGSYWAAWSLRVPAKRLVHRYGSIVYRRVGWRALRLDVYARKDGDGQKRPAVLYIHGGGWVIGTRRQSRHMMYELAAAGWTVFAVSYRLAPWNKLPAALIDCKHALAWVKSHADTWGVDPERIVVMGGSAGGHLANMLALTGSEKRWQEGFEEQDLRVQGAVVLYGLSDLFGVFGRERPHLGLSLLLRYLVVGRALHGNEALYASLSPLRLVHAEAPPFLLVHGDRDLLVPPEHSDALCEALRARGVRAHRLEIPFGVHAFEVTPGPSHFRAVRVITDFLESVKAVEGHGRAAA